MRRLDAMTMSFCLSLRLFVRSSVACEICQVIRYVEAPGGEWGLFISSLIHLSHACYKCTRHFCRQTKVGYSYLSAVKRTVCSRFHGICCWRQVSSWSRQPTRSARIQAALPCHSVGNRRMYLALIGCHRSLIFTVELSLLPVNTWAHNSDTWQSRQLQLSVIKIY